MSENRPRRPGRVRPRPRGLDDHRRAAQGQIEALQNTSERVEWLRLMQQNPILTIMGQTEDMRRGYYNDLELRVEIDKGDVKICGVFGSQYVIHTSMSGKERSRSPSTH